MQPVFVPVAGASSDRVYGTLAAKKAGLYCVSFCMTVVAPVGSAMAAFVPATNAATKRLTLDAYTGSLASLSELATTTSSA